MCIHCSGRHRELGVQYSRIRSLKLDAIKTSELLVSCVLAKLSFIKCGEHRKSLPYHFINRLASIIRRVLAALDVFLPFWFHLGL